MTIRSERSLGRGLGALIPPRPAGDGTHEIPLARIRSSPFQPRRRMDEPELRTLAASIAEHGVIQPILVTETLDGYRLVAGERRVHAARLAGLERIPAVIRQLADREQLELALVENLQREDLDPIETATAYRQLIDEFEFTHEMLAARVGRARSTVANTLRLLELASGIQQAIASGAISEGHGRALGGLAVEHQERVLPTVVEQGLSVRLVEELVRRIREPKAVNGAAGRAPRTSDPEIERVEDDLRHALGTKVHLARTRRGGRIVIEYYSDEELGRLYDRLIGGTA